MVYVTGGWNSAVVIATRYLLDGPVSYPGGSEIFRARPDRPGGPPILFYDGYWVFPVGKAAGAWCYPFLVPRLRMVWNYTAGLSSVLAWACHGVTLTFICYYPSELV